MSVCWICNAHNTRSSDGPSIWIRSWNVHFTSELHDSSWNAELKNMWNSWWFSGATRYENHPSIGRGRRTDRWTDSHACDRRVARIGTSSLKTALTRTFAMCSEIVFGRRRKRKRRSCLHLVLLPLFICVDNLFFSSPWKRCEGDDAAY